ncbi:MAG: DMT family transporter [Tepidisphaeraceae bacterium]
MLSDTQFGLLLALGTTLLWSVSSVVFDMASRRVGSVPVNVIRLAMAVVCLASYVWIASKVTGVAIGWPSGRQTIMVAASGLVGFFICDLFLFRAFVLIGARTAQLLLCVSPIFAAIAGYFIAGEHLAASKLVGVAVTLAGVAWVITQRAPSEEHKHNRRALWTGVGFALIGAMTQGMGLPMAKLGVLAIRPGEHPLDPALATLIRASTGLLCFLFFASVTGRMPRTVRALRNGKGMLLTSIGAVAGPFLGVTLAVASTRYVETSLAITVTSLVPITIIPLAIIVQKEHITWRAIAGSAVAVVGVILLAWW